MLDWKCVGLLAALLVVACSQQATPVAATPAARPAATTTNALTSLAAGAPRRAAGGSAGSSLGSDEAPVAAWSRDFRHAVREHAQRLTARPDGRSQLAAALLLRISADQGAGANGGDDATLAALLVRAGELAPDDPLVAWLELLQCPRSQPACRPGQALARLQRLDPDNAAVWLATLDEALARGDRAAIDTALERAARAEHYNDRWNETGRFFDAALAEVMLPARNAALLAAQRRQAGTGVAPSEAELRSTHAIAMATAVALPGLSALTRSCRGDGPATRQSDCLAVFSRLAASDTLLGRSVGLASAVRLTAGTPANAAWREQLRNFHWLRSEAIARFATLPPDYAQRLWRDGEVAALQSLLTAAGRPLLPPPGWLPANADLRALISTGRPPPG